MRKGIGEIFSDLKINGVSHQTFNGPGAKYKFHKISFCV